MKIILFLVMLVLSAITHAQTAVTESEKTTTVVKPASKQTKTTKSSVSVSISNSDNNYSLQASFDAWKTKKIEKLLSDNLDNSLLSTNGNTKIWKKENNGQTAYSFVLQEEKLKVNIDKELVSDETFERLKALGRNISETLSEKK